MLRALWDDSGVRSGDASQTTAPTPADRRSLPGDVEPPVQEECGVFGVWAPGEEVSRLVYFALTALQHRGQEAAGIATTDGSNILVYKDLGLVSQVFDDRSLSALTGHMAVGHVRYATTGATTWENAQPMLGPVAGSTLALTHNGNLTNTRQLMEAVRATSGEDLTGELGRGSSTDTAVIAAVMNLVSERGALDDEPPVAEDDADTELYEPLDEAEAAATAPFTIGQAARRVLPLLRGAYSLVFMNEQTLYAARDPHGMHPLVLGRLERGWVVASETAALDIVGATYVRDIEPGELIEIDADGVRSTRFARPRRSGCVFEYVYFARPDSKIAGRSVIAARNAMGAALAREHPVEADLVIATPESGTPAAIGYAQESGIPYGQGLFKNAYVGRTFIQPTQTLRQLGIRLKLNPVREVIEGNRLVVVDDSIVRGNTQRALVKMLREAGAAEVHIRISSPPVMWPCYYGIDFATRAELIATGMSVEEIRESVGADTLGYLSVDGMVGASGQPADSLCMACFTGSYPMKPPFEGVPIGTLPISRVPSVYRRRHESVPVAVAATGEQPQAPAVVSSLPASATTPDGAPRFTIPPFGGRRAAAPAAPADQQPQPPDEGTAR